MELQAVCDALKKRGFGATHFATAQEAAEYLCREITGTTVGFGGSMTLLSMGLYEQLSQNNTCYWHWKPQEGVDTRRMAQLADVYLLSANAISAQGQIINIDGTGNRVAGQMFGHKKVYIVAGRNKIAPNYEEAYYRARNVAAPLNAKRLGCKTPCAEKGDKCYDCNSAERICRIFDRMERCPMGLCLEVVLVDECLGY